MQDVDVNKFRMSVFDENDPAQMQEKLMVCFGMCAGFRGCMEHAMLKVTDVVNGFFPSDHPTFPNIEWWGLKALNSDKNHCSWNALQLRSRLYSLWQVPSAS